MEDVRVEDMGETVEDVTVKTYLVAACIIDGGELAHFM